MATALDFYRPRRRWLLLLAVAGVSGYGAYRLYHLPSVTRRRRQLARLAVALLSVADAASASADTVSLVSSDLNRFLRSDSNELPSSLKQLSKIATSGEFSASLSTVSEAVTAGILRGYRSSPAAETDSSFAVPLVDKLFSPAGSGFASVVVGSFARNLVLAFYSVADTKGDSEQDPQWLRLVCSDNSRELIADCIQRFVSTAVTVYLDKTMDINTYEELFSGLTNPKHEPKMKDVLVSVCNGAIETLVKTSHQVLTSSNSSASLSRIEELSEGSDMRSSNGTKAKDGSGWLDQVSSTLAVPSNRKFVLDVTGKVTFESVRSFLEFLMCKMYDCAKRSVNAAHEEVVERGLEVVRCTKLQSKDVEEMESSLRRILEKAHCFGEADAIASKWSAFS